MRELLDDEAVLTASGGHPLISQLLPHRIAGAPNAWAVGGAVAVRHDYWEEPVIAMAGPPADVACLLRSLAVAVPAAHVSYPSAQLPPVPVEDTHGWGFAWRTAPVGSDPATATWLPAEAAPEIDALLDAAFPHASTRPTSRHARRWAGIRDASGALLACIVDCSYSPDLGFVASLAVLPAARGRGLGESLLRWACDELIRERGRIALWYDDDNAPAIAIYTRLGFTLMPMTSGDLVSGVR
ncbi:MAG: putative GCN5-related N-acetyltransferase [Frankiales bacterium]|nr:putative GCN5-related N-acetyltransferase [Frankiales bacterium]